MVSRLILKRFYLQDIPWIQLDRSQSLLQVLILLDEGIYNIGRGDQDCLRVVQKELQDQPV